MARTTTKLELAQALAERNTQLEAARLRIAELEGDLALARQRLGSLQPSAAVVKSNYQLACEKARELAAKTGRSVRVG
jgi:hypothetical protein